MIENFREIRVDGQVIYSGMSFDEISALGRPSKITEAVWTCRNKEVRLKPGGHLSVVVSPMGEYAITLEDEDADGRGWASLKVYSDTGNLVKSMPSDVLASIFKPAKFYYLDTPKNDRLCAAINAGSKGIFRLYFSYPELNYLEWREHR